VTDLEKMALIAKVSKAVEEDPGMFTRLVVAAKAGLELRAISAMERAADFELSTSCLLEYIKKGQRNKRGNLSLALEKIAQWKDRTSINWPFFQKHLDAHATAQVPRK